MDSKVEDKMVRQIEKSLSNNINDNLFLSGRIFEKESNQPTEGSTLNAMEKLPNVNDFQNGNPAVSLEYINQSPSLSRAEYIRQAREACLRQISAIQSSARAYDTYYPEVDTPDPELLNRKKSKALKLFHDGSLLEGANGENNTPQEVASFRFLVIRTVCAIVLFLSIFIFDKFDFKIGSFTPEVIQEYVTGNDTLQEFENIIVTWLDK